MTDDAAGEAPGAESEREAAPSLSAEVAVIVALSILLSQSCFFVGRSASILLPQCVVLRNAISSATLFLPQSCFFLHRSSSSVLLLSQSFLLPQPYFVLDPVSSSSFSCILLDPA